jgi:uncharacterized protein
VPQLLPKQPLMLNTLRLFAACLALSVLSCAAQPVRPESAAAELSCTGAACAARCADPADAECAELAYRYELGAGVHQDYAEAARLYRVACSGGAGEACTRLAIMYDIGLSVPENTLQAIALYQQACELGETWSCHRARQLH